MNIVTTTNEIHDKLNKLGLSPDPRYSGNFTFLSSSNMTARFTLNSKRLSWDVNISNRIIFMCWLLFGGRLKINRP